MLFAKAGVVKQTRTRMDRKSKRMVTFKVFSPASEGSREYFLTIY
jgi:hypothetical protein